VCAIFIFVTVFLSLLVTGLYFGTLGVQIPCMLTLVLSVLLKIKLSGDVKLLTWRVATGVLKQFSAFFFRVKGTRKNSLKTLRFSETSRLLTSDTWYISEDVDINNAVIRTQILVVSYCIF
jgi:hypothetical protein